MRTVGSRYPFAGLGLGLDTPPVPIAAALDTGTGAWSCTFDQPLQPAVLTALNWMMRTGSSTWAASSAASSGAVVSGASSNVGPDAPGDAINFAPPPFDVLSLTGLPAVAFTDFALVVV